MNSKVRVAVRFIEDNLHRDMYVDEVSQFVGLSRSRFCHLFKSEVGMPFTQYVKQRRMVKASRLLETTFEPIKAIAYEVGYNNPDYFESEFKKVYGLTPSEYRVKHVTDTREN